MLLRSATSIVVLTLMSTAAIAAPVATLSDVVGTVLIDQGRGFVVVSDKTDVASGSRVMLSRNGGATLVYAGVGGCKLTLSANTITTVSSASDCKPTAQVAGQAPAPVVTPPPTIPPVVIGLGVAVAAAAGVSLAVLSSQQNQPPASN